MRIAFGLTRLDSGVVTAAGARRAITSPTDAIAAGIGMVHQHFSNVPAMTVAENVALGGHGGFELARAARRVVEIGSRTGLDLNPLTAVESLPVGAQQRLEIVKALAREARTLILDEPTAVLAPSEAEELLRWLRAFAKQGNAVILITHKLDEALATADVVTVLRRGRVVLRALGRELEPRALADAILGTEIVAEPQVADATPSDDVVASVTDAQLTDERGVTVLREANVEIRAGEILGLVGVEGSGQRELLRVLARRATANRGEVRLPPTPGFVPEDRQRDALVLGFTVAENV